MALCYNGPFPPLLMPPISTKNAQNEEPAARQLTLRAFEKPVALAILTAAITVTMFLRFMTLADRMTHCDDTGFLVNALPASSALEAGNLVAKAWTYGPGQFVLGYPLWASAPTWRQTVFAARIPSGIAEMLGLLLIVWLLSKIGFGLKPGLHSPRTAPFAGLFSAVLALCSLRAMIESQQGYPYAAACAMVALTAALLYQFTAACNGLPLSKLPVWTGILALTGGLFVTVSYQITISIAASILALWIIAAPQLRETGAYKKFTVAGIAAGVGLCLTGLGIFGLIWNLYLGDHIRNNRGIPVWASFDVIHWNGAFDYARAILLKWIYFAGFNTTPIWVADSRQLVPGILGAIVLVLALFGLASLSPTQPLWRRLLATYCSLLLATTFLLGLAGKAPFGVTRHSHFLLPALVILSGFGEANLLARLPRFPRMGWIGAAMATAVLALFCFGFTEFNNASRNRFDIPLLAQLAHDRKPMRILATGCTFDPLAAQAASHDQLFTSPVINDLTEDQAEPAFRLMESNNGPASIFLVNHRADPYPLKALALHPALRSRLLVGIQPIGSTELVGIVNGGNGFYVREISKGIAGESVPCQATWLEGWYNRESDSKQNDWWRWSRGDSSLRISTGQAFELTFDGGLMQAFGPQTIDVFVNGVLALTLEAKPALDFSVSLAAGDNLVRLKVRQPGIHLGQDPRMLSFAVRNLVLRPQLRDSAVCELN